MLPAAYRVIMHRGLKTDSRKDSAAEYETAHCCSLLSRIECATSAGGNAKKQSRRLAAEVGSGRPSASDWLLKVRIKGSKMDADDPSELFWETRRQIARATRRKGGSAEEIGGVSACSLS